MPIKRQGNYSKVSIEKRRQINRSFVQAREFPSLTAIANHFGVSKTTVKKFLLESIDTGQISEQNHLLQRTRGNRAKVEQVRRDRSESIKQFVIDQSKKGVPVSVNMLQKKFGGEKKFIMLVLDRIEQKLVNTKTPVIRRTKSSQPKRKS